MDILIERHSKVGDRNSAVVVRYREIFGGALIERVLATDLTVRQAHVLKKFLDCEIDVHYMAAKVVADDNRRGK